MTESESPSPPVYQKRLDKYLDAIELELLATDATRASRRSILEMVESQVVEMCREKLPEEAAEADIEAVFQQLDPPQMYAEGFDRQTQSAPVSATAKPRWTRRFEDVSRLSLLSIALLAMPFLGGCFALILQEDVAVAFFFMTLLASVFGAPIAAVFALRQIRASAGKLRGRQLALISLCTSTILVVNLVVLYMGIILQEVGLALAVLITFGALNFGLVFLMRRAIERWLPANGVHSEPEVEVTGNATPAII